MAKKRKRSKRPPAKKQPPKAQKPLKESSLRLEINSSQKKLLVFAAVFCLSTIGAVAMLYGIGKPSVPAGDIALVQDSPSGNITLNEYKDAFEQSWRRAGLPQKPDPGNQQYNDVKDAAISDLLDQAWLEGQAVELGVSATGREVRNELDSIRKTQFSSERAFEQFVKESGLTPRAVRQRVRLQIISRKIEESVRSSVSEPTAEEIEQYYRASEDQYTEPEKRSMVLIATSKKADVKKIQSSLAKDDSEASFSRLARKYSQDSSGASGGKTSTDRGPYPPEVTTAISETALGDAGGPIPASDKKTYFFLVTDITPETTKTLLSVRKEITKQLTPYLEQKALSNFISDYNALWISRTVCAEGFITERCSNYKAETQNQEADPACYDKKKLDKLKAEGKPIACPAPIIATRPIEPGSNGETDGFGELLTQPLPQGPFLPETAQTTSAQPTTPPASVPISP